MNIIRFRSTNPQSGQTGVGEFSEINQAPGRMYIISGPSGSGKGTVMKGFFADPQIQDAFSQIKSYKTRPARPGEEGSKDSKSITLDEFMEMKRNNKLFQWAQFDGNWYGSSIDEVLGKLRQGINLVFEMTAECALQVKQIYPQKVTTIFNAPPAPELEVLRQRLIKRGTNSPESIAERLEQAKAELKLMPQFDKILVNDNLQRAIDELKQFVTQPTRFAGIHRLFKPKSESKAS